MSEVFGQWEARVHDFISRLATIVMNEQDNEDVMDDLLLQLEDILDQHGEGR